MSLPHEFPEQQLDKLVTSLTGELVDERSMLFTSPDWSATWQQWANRNPRILELWQAFKIVGTDDSDKWLHLVEHNMFVAAVATTMGEKLVGTGLDVDLQVVESAGMIHDAGVRYNIEKRISREKEATGEDRTVVDTMKAHGFSDSVISAALNTGRAPDRYLPLGSRRQAIVSRSIEANILSLADARTNDARVVSLEEAQGHYLSVKKDAASQMYFTGPWLNYYKDVEAYLLFLAPAFDPQAINQDLVLATVARLVSPEH